jgi:hypothetical protein
MLVVINRPSEYVGRAGFGLTLSVCVNQNPPWALPLINGKINQRMNPKSPDRFAIRFESSFRAAGRQFPRAIYTRGGDRQPGCYLIRLRMRHVHSQFRPRLRFL